MSSLFDTPLEYLKGVGSQRAEVLKKELNVFVFRQLLEYFPFRYEDRSKIHKINEIQNETSYIQLKGIITNIKLITSQTKRLVATFRDHTGEVELVWFKGISWVKKTIQINQEYIVFGKPNFFNGKYSIPHPEMENTNEEVKNTKMGLYPVYNSSEKLKSVGLNSKGISKLILALLEKTAPYIEETLPNHVLQRFKLVGRNAALNLIHFPSDQQDLNRAILRLKFEELFWIQLRLLLIKKGRNETSKGYIFQKVGEYFNTFYQQHLNFELTNAQKKVIKEIRTDLGKGKQMNRLLQGDVGSGKTIVALLIALIALDNKYQVCLMAPTEILANQHYQSFCKLLNALPIQIGLLTGSTKTSEKKEILNNAHSGRTHILIGTHALIEDTVAFSKLGLVIIDEQHRFGVAQRAKLWKKSEIPPHVLVMTATPIPRTLAMTLYGDLDFSVINELPPGRKSIKTLHLFDNDRLKVFGFIKKQIQAGHQIYIVYPLIEESEKLDLKDLMDGYESISRAFPLPQYAISIVHGKMKAKDKDYEMQRFIKKETQILVSTTVIEVGVDVPNASVMLIENAERFGLSQLHQLRGRVGRGAAQSYCILMTSEKLSEDAKKRIQTMVMTNDGFEIADADLKLRGPGDIEGTQQSGLINLNIANLAKDEKILKVARNLATEIIESDPSLSKPEHALLKLQLQQHEKNKTLWGRIS